MFVWYSLAFFSMCLYFCITVVFYSDLFYPMWMYVCCIWINQSVSQSVFEKLPVG